MDLSQVDPEIVGRLEATLNPEESDLKPYNLNELRAMGRSINNREKLIIIDINKPLSNIADQLLFYYQNPIPTRTTFEPDEQLEQENRLNNLKFDLYREVILLLKLNGFSLSQFRISCQTAQRNFETCTNIFEAALTHDLAEPLSHGKSAVEAVSRFIDLNFSPYFNKNRFIHANYQKRLDRVLGLTRKLETLAERDWVGLDQFWQSYCDQYLEVEVDSDKISKFLAIVAECWESNHYPSLSTIRYIVDHFEGSIFEAGGYHGYRVFTDIDTLFEDLQIPATDEKKHLDAFYREIIRRPLPKLKEGMEIEAVEYGEEARYQINEIVHQNIASYLNFCFRETDYPTPDGLVTIPYSIDYFQYLRNHLAEIENKLREAANPEHLIISRFASYFYDRTNEIEISLGSFLYREP